MRILCLYTLKRLLSKGPAKDLELPESHEPQTLLLWAEKALAATFSLIAKLSLKDLSALECQVIPATIAMQRAGLPFDSEAWERELGSLSAEVEQLKLRLQTLLVKDSGFALFGPEPLDLNSATEVKTSLEAILGTKLIGTSQSALRDFHDHETVQLLLRFREGARMLSTYGDNFLIKIKNGRIHANFEPLGSASGRFACHNPNLQALPNDKRFQSCIRAKAPRKLLYFDYGAFELRILAALSNDSELLKIFGDDQDIHSMVASAVFKCPVSKSENAHLRDQAKVLNFGIVYGMGERALSRQLKISLPAAKEMLDSYFIRFKRVKEYLRSLEEQALTQGFVQTALGRRLYFNTHLQDQQAARRLARNMPIQGTGADIAKLALCRVYGALFAHGSAQVVNMVHDELVIEAHEDEQSQISTLVKNEMSQAFLNILPNVRAEIGLSYC